MFVKLNFRWKLLSKIHRITAIFPNPFYSLDYCIWNLFICEMLCNVHIEERRKSFPHGMPQCIGTADFLRLVCQCVFVAFFVCYSFYFQNQTNHYLFTLNRMIETFKSFNNTIIFQANNSFVFLLLFIIRSLFNLIQLIFPLFSNSFYKSEKKKEKPKFYRIARILCALSKRRNKLNLAKNCITLKNQIRC